MPFYEQDNLARNMEAAFASQGNNPNPFRYPPHLGLSQTLSVLRRPYQNQEENLFRFLACSRLSVG